MQLYIAFIYLISIVATVYLFFVHKFSYWRNRGVPHLKPTIPVGNFKNIGKTKHLKDLLNEIYFTFKNKARYAGTYFTIAPMLMITDLDLVKDILIKDFTCFQDRPAYYNEKDDPISAHLFSIDGEKWRKLRNILSPTFTAGKMKFMFPTILKVSDQLIDCLSESVKVNSIVDIKDFLASFTIDIIGNYAFGIECNSLKDPNAQFRVIANKVLTDNKKRNRIAVEIMRHYPALGRRLGLKVFAQDVIDFFTGVVKETIEFRVKNNIRRNDFMDLMIQLKNNEGFEGVQDGWTGSLTLHQIAAQAFIYFVAGFETSASSMTFSLYELAKNQQLQDKARQQIDEVLAKHNGTLTYEALQEITFIDLIISETLRKYPPLITLNRIAKNDYRVKNSNLIIEKGMGVIIPVYAIHHDPEIYPNPDVYDPERFSPNQENQRHSMSFLGFGDGPRNCIGLRLGRMQSRIGLTTILKNFRVSICHKTAIKYSLASALLLTEGGLYLQLEKI